MRADENLYFESFRLDLTNEQLWRDAEAIPLRPKAYALLRYLLDNPNRLVSQDELKQALWRHQYQSDGLLRGYIRELRRTLGDDAAAPRFIETASGRGYRFLATVARAATPTSTAAVREDPQESDGHPEGVPEGRRQTREWPAIAVLPFVNLSGDPEQEFFGDGMCEDIITLLSGVPDFLVISRSSTFAYKGQGVDVRAVARDLGVRYVLQGSIRKAGHRIRVSVQFVDARRGVHVWAESYDRALEDIFAVQDEVARAIVGSLPTRLLNAEFGFVSRTPAEAIGAWGNVVSAKVKLFAFRRRDLDEAEPYARKAIDIDPGYGPAHAVLGHILAWRCFNRWTDDWLQAGRDAAASCKRALELAPNDAGVLTDIGAAYWFLGRLLPAVSMLERADQLNPNSAMNCAQLGQALACVGRASEGVAQVSRAFSISPKDPLAYLFHGNLAFAEYFDAQYERALQSALRALAIHPELVHVMLLFSAICVRLNRHDEGSAMLHKVEALGSSWAVDNLFRPRTEGTNFRLYTDAIRELRQPAARV